jgi:transcriptional regulator with XRE-family HTH domain
MHTTSLRSAELMCNYLAGNRFQLAMCFNIRMNQLTHTLPATLQRARKARRLSQLELALQLAVSQRHVSFVESGRAKPSRDLLTAWLQALDAPLAVRNAALLQAGYAPMFSEAQLGDPQLAVANAALQALLMNHDPLPAFVLDAQWNIVHINRGALWLAQSLLGDAGIQLPIAADGRATAAINMLDLLTHPQGFMKSLVNLREVGPSLLALLRSHAATQPMMRPRVEAFAGLLHAQLGTSALQQVWLTATAPVLTSRFATPHGELAFFSMFTTFGTPQDITLASLRVEHMFAGDEHTQAVMKAQVRIAETGKPQ